MALGHGTSSTAFREFAIKDTHGAMGWSIRLTGTSAHFRTKAKRTVKQLYHSGKCQQFRGLRKSSRNPSPCPRTKEERQTRCPNDFFISLAQNEKFARISRTPYLPHHPPGRLNDGARSRRHDGARARHHPVRANEHDPRAAGLYELRHGKIVRLRCTIREADRLCDGGD